jgi:hypothetical protein
LLLLAWFSVTATAVAQEQVLVESGASISYLANSSAPGIGMSWTERDFPDGGWDVGSYGIGYDTQGAAQDLLQTTVLPGTLSVFTRATFTVSDPGSIQNLWIGSDHDDGVVAWINGTEVYRSPEMPQEGPLDWNTPPVAAGEASNAESPVYAPYHDISSAALPWLEFGENVLAVGVWNTSASSSDLVLVPRLVANTDLQLTPGPYLQMGTPTSVRVRWRTDVLENSRVVYGPAPGSLTSSVVDPALLLEHEIQLSDLQPGTRYYYLERRRPRVGARARDRAERSAAGNPLLLRDRQHGRAAGRRGHGALFRDLAAAGHGQADAGLGDRRFRDGRRPPGARRLRGRHGGHAHGSVADAGRQRLPRRDG